MFYDIYIRFKTNGKLIVFERAVKSEHLPFIIDTIKQMYLIDDMRLKYPDFEIVIK